MLCPLQPSGAAVLSIAKKKTNPTARAFDKIPLEDQMMTVSLGAARQSVCAQIIFGAVVSTAKRSPPVNRKTA